ncbi:MAG: glycosyltransferase family 2 protein [Pirellulaceae bacterium]|nr:glycosyltransferase family 2 protein [Pirellulaceae bacterium]
MENQYPVAPIDGFTIDTARPEIAVDDLPGHRLSVIVPCFNEEGTVETILRRVRAALPGAEIIVVDDGSGDKTVERAEMVASEVCLKLLSLSKNCGKGAAVRAGLSLVTREWVVIQDADLEYDPQDIGALLDYAQTKDAPVVYGARYLQAGRAAGAARLNYFAVKMLAVVQWLIYGRWLSDPHTCYKLIKADLFEPLDLKSNGFELCAEINSKLLAMGVEIQELPIGYQPRTVAEGKKIKSRDFFVAAWTYLWVRLTNVAGTARKQGLETVAPSTAETSSGLWRWSYVISRVAISGLLMFAGAGKLGSPDMLPLTPWLILPSGVVFAWGVCEFSLGALGMTLWGHRALNRWLVSMFLGFVGLLSVQWMAGMETCQCLGATATDVRWMFLLDMLIVGTLILFRREWQRPVSLGSGLVGEQLGNLRIVFPCLLVGTILWFGSMDAGLGYFSGETVLVDRASKFAGVLQRGDVVEGQWRLQNISGKKVRILGARNSCRCVVVEDLPLTIDPQAVQTIRFRIYGNVADGIRKEAIELYFDDPSFRRRLEVVFVVRSGGQPSEQVVSLLR